MSLTEMLAPSAFVLLVIALVGSLFLIQVPTKAEKAEAALVECQLSGIPKATCEDVIAEREFGSRGCW